MADWSLIDANRVEYMPSGANPFTGIAVVGSASANVKGSWTALGNAPFDCSGIQITVHNYASATDYLADIGVGASGSERVAIEDLYTCGNGGSRRSTNYCFPLALKSGDRVCMRDQNATGSSTLTVTIGWFASGFMGSPMCRGFETYGVVKTTSSGTALAAPAANAWGAWTQIVAATRDHSDWVLPLFGDQDLATRTASNRFAFQMGIGASGSERVLTPPWHFTTSSTVLTYNAFKDYWINIPRGSALSLRYAAVTALNLGLDGTIMTGRFS